MKNFDEKIRLAIDSELSSIHLDAAQKDAILRQCRPSLTVLPRRRPMRRVLTVAAALAAAMALSVGTLAAAPELRESLKGLSEQTIQMLQPVNQVSEDQGIRMEVLGAVNDGDVAVAFLSMQDTTGQGRVGDTVRLWDCTISSEYSFASNTLVRYDATTDTAVLRLEGTGSGLGSDKINITVGSVLGGEHYVSDAPTGYTLGQLIASGPAAEYAPPAEGQVRETMVGASDQQDMDRLDQLVDIGGIPLLTAWPESVAIPGVDWARITAAAQIGDQVHVQYSADSVMGGVNSIAFSLRDKEGTVLDLPVAQLGIGEINHLSDTLYSSPAYEYVMLLPDDASAAEMELLYSGTTYDHLTQGQWSTTFKLERVDEKLTCPVEEDMSGWTVEMVKVSPVALTITGSGEMDWGEPPEVRIWMQDGTELEVGSCSTSVTGEEVTMTSIFTEIIDLDQVDKVTFNGQELAMERRSERDT